MVFQTRDNFSTTLTGDNPEMKCGWETFLWTEVTTQVKYSKWMADSVLTFRQNDVITYK